MKAEQQPAGVVGSKPEQMLPLPVADSKPEQVGPVLVVDSKQELVELALAVGNKQAGPAARTTLAAQAGRGSIVGSSLLDILVHPMLA